MLEILLSKQAHVYSITIQILDVNLWGVINGSNAFTESVINSNEPGLVVITGSKQGITCPPGNPAYNVSKAGVKAFTEQLAHELREATGDRVTAHLLVPGWTFTKVSNLSQLDIRVTWLGLELMEPWPAAHEYPRKERKAGRSMVS